MWSPFRRSHVREGGDEWMNDIFRLLNVVSTYGELAWLIGS